MYKYLFLQPYSYEIKMFTNFRFGESICHFGIVVSIRVTA